ncbi:MAG: hypothetical protein ACT4O0_21255 [Pseudonocardia sp.]
MTRPSESDAATRNPDVGGVRGRDGAPPTQRDTGTAGGPSGPHASGGPDGPGAAGVAARPGAPSTSFGGGAPPTTRQPLPGPPAGFRSAGGYRPAAPRFAQPPPRRRLTPAQGSRLGLIASVIVLLGAAVGLAVTLVLPTQYAARTVIEYTVAQENASSFLRTDRNLTTQLVLLTSRSVLGPVADASGITPDRLSEKVTVTNLANSELIQVDVLDPSREVGVRLADAIGRRYLEVVNTSGLRGLVQERLDEAERDLATAPAGPVGSPAATARAELQSRVNTLQSQLDTIALTGNRAVIAVPAYSVAAPAAPKPAVAAATGALLGVVVAGLVAIALSRRWTRS